MTDATMSGTGRQNYSSGRECLVGFSVGSAGLPRSLWCTKNMWEVWLSIVTSWVVECERRLNTRTWASSD